MKEFLMSEISTQTHQPLHRLRYIIESRGFQPSRRVGGYKLYSADTVAGIKAAIAEIDSRGRH